ncbi:hypothetical protein EZV62_023633 [Acer yangbiense]|uniref:DUF4283 domain-containing protein n=1 Tax=Acer yangbiense TaxID=1000413 RepID=A0A5C7H2W5_9ROSI|nr:hypothetical protein EZV62_023633 [Acer yangbiense]
MISRSGSSPDWVGLDSRSVDPCASNLVVFLKDNHIVAFSAERTSGDYAGGSDANDSHVAGVWWYGYASNGMDSQYGCVWLCGTKARGGEILLRPCMDQEEISRLCASLLIHSKEEKLWSVRDSLKESAGKKLDLCLVGKVLSTKHVNREAFRAVIPKIWQTKLEIEVVQDNIFLFYFRNQGDRFRVLAGGPWCFDNSFLVLEKLFGTGDIAKVGFNRVVFWVQIPNAPLLCMTKEMGEFLGQLIGELIVIDVGVTGECFGKYLRLKECHNGKRTDSRASNMEFDFGPWLRATNPSGQNKTFGHQRARSEKANDRPSSTDASWRSKLVGNGSKGQVSALRASADLCTGSNSGLSCDMLPGDLHSTGRTAVSEVDDRTGCRVLGERVSDVADGGNEIRLKKWKWKRWAREGGVRVIEPVGETTKVGKRITVDGETEVESGKHEECFEEYYCEEKEAVRL